MGIWKNLRTTHGLAKKKKERLGGHRPAEEAFASIALSPHHLGCFTYEKEITAIIFAVTNWQPYLVG
jgi:hypothetical protein